MGKAPGPEGFMIQYYKLILPTLGPYMVNLFNSLGPENDFPRENLKAHNFVMPKEEKDPAYCGSYRPISMLNFDLKLFTKILACRLLHCLSQMVHLDQVGFIPTCKAQDNTVKVLNLIHIANATPNPMCFPGYSILLG